MVVTKDFGSFSPRSNRSIPTMNTFEIFVKAKLEEIAHNRRELDNAELMLKRKNRK